MTELGLRTILQLVVALGLINVWLLRAKSPTAYRGGDAKSLAQEFEAYGLPSWMFYAVGVLKIGSAVALIVGIWIPALVQPAAALVLALMLGALTMHIKIGDPLTRSLPALAMLTMSAGILFLG